MPIKECKCYQLDGGKEAMVISVYGWDLTRFGQFYS